MKNSFILVIASTLLLFSLSAWSASTKQEIIELRAQVDEMQKDLVEIKKLLKDIKAAPPARAAAQPFKEQVVSVGNSPYKGDANATLTLMEFSDYQCPFCARHYRDVMPTLQAEYIDTGKLKFVMRENPIPNLHRDAMNASMAALCAGDQGKYWEMHDMMFDNQKKLGVDDLKGYAGAIGLDTASFNTCLETNKFSKQINADKSSADKMGVRGTPGFVLGVTDSNDPDKAMMTVYIRGARPLASFKQEIDSLLESIE